MKPRIRLPYFRNPSMFLGLRLGLGRRVQDQQSGFWNNREGDMIVDDFGTVQNYRGVGYEYDHRAEGDDNQGRE